MRDEAHPVDGDDLAELAVPDRPPGLAHVGAVPPVMADENRDAARLAGVDESQRGGDGVRHGLLDEHRDAALDAGEPRLEVELVRQRDDRAVGLRPRRACRS